MFSSTPCQRIHTTIAIATTHSKNASGVDGGKRLLMNATSSAVKLGLRDRIYFMKRQWAKQHTRQNDCSCKQVCHPEHVKAVVVTMALHCTQSTSKRQVVGVSTRTRTRTRLVRNFLQPSEDGEATFERVFAEKHLEASLVVVSPRLPVGEYHCNLVQVREQQAHGPAVGSFHRRMYTFRSHFAFSLAAQLKPTQLTTGLPIYS